jgi:hypothetical protein
MTLAAIGWLLELFTPSSVNRKNNTSNHKEHGIHTGTVLNGFFLVRELEESSGSA